jgi:tubulin polyglutamylase TTLL4
VISKNQHLKKRSGYVLSKYVSKPHLLNGYKYDLRLYVLVTSFEPLKIYLFREGLVRCATTPYSTSKASLKQRFVHLTNYSVNKKADAYVKNVNANVAAETQGSLGEADNEGGGDAPVESKLNLNQLRKEYVKMGVDYDQVFTSIQDVLIKSVLSVEQPIVTAMGGGKHKSTCFEIYGFDILIDSKLRPWLLEVNVSPSLSSSSPMDKQIKTLLLSDSLYLTGFRLFDRKKLEQEKAKKDKQRLLGFDSSAKNNAQLKSVTAGVSSGIRAKEDSHEDADSPAVR